jgi:hypothetical protein
MRLQDQVSPTAFQLGPGFVLMGPPPAIVFPFISQIEVWPLVFWVVEGPVNSSNVRGAHSAATETSEAGRGRMAPCGVGRAGA